MKLEIFTLCDAATDSGRKLNILGSFDTLWAKEEPIAHPACAIAIKMRFARIEEGNHRVKLTFADADGKLVMPGLDSSVAVRLGPKDSSGTVNLVLNIQQIRLPSFGEYTIDLAVDGRQEGSLPLYVKKRPEAPPVS